MTVGDRTWELFTSKEQHGFSAAHFVVYKGFREPIHGHNYAVGTRLFGRGSPVTACTEVDDQDLSAATSAVCEEMNLKLLCPILSDVITHDEKDNHVHIDCLDGEARYVIPRRDCLFVPLKHTTCEELALYVYGRVVQKLGLNTLKNGNVRALEISVQEAPDQVGIFSTDLPGTLEDLDGLMLLPMTPHPCSSFS
eukprot:462403_1